MERLSMHPAPGGHALKFVGDTITFSIGSASEPLPDGWRAFLRTNLGRGQVRRNEIIHAHSGRLALRNEAWHDLPMEPRNGVWSRTLALTEGGYFQAKPYAVDPDARQHWPDGPDAGVCVHPDAYRSANTIYCAFTRMFGKTRALQKTENEPLDHLLQALDHDGYSVIPSSGKLRDLIEQLPHIMDTLGCRILHLLPVNPTPTTLAKFGRFGSPYAVQDLTAIDPALVEFDKRTTGVDQFRELTYAVHTRGGRVLLDVVANHTGWGSRLFEGHPDWFVRNERGEFVSPGAWGVTWEDLVELDHRNPVLWETLADVFLTWCKRGVDGFRCDAGYKIPLPAWRYITAHVTEEYPETVFLLEGLGGSWEATENLLKEGGMQWAYSELFQNYSGREAALYLDYALKQSEQAGVYVHYSETHDNTRLAAKGRAWSLLRNRLCALTSVAGGFGFTCGVEWLAAEKINVHSNRGLSWGNPDNILPELAELNGLLATHPCFFDGARLNRLSPEDSVVLALSRVSADGMDKLLVLVNTDPEQAASLLLSRPRFKELGEPVYDLLSRRAIRMESPDDLQVKFTLAPAECCCLGAAPVARSVVGDDYRRKRALAAWALVAARAVIPAEAIGRFDWRQLADGVETGPARFLNAIGHMEHACGLCDFTEELPRVLQGGHFDNVIRWELISARRITVVPPEHWLLLEDDAAFRATLTTQNRDIHVTSVLAGKRHFASFAPTQPPGDATLTLERYGSAPERVSAAIRYLSASADLTALEFNRVRRSQMPLIGRELGVALLTNGIGGMTRLQIDLGETKSKYDCALAANLHPSVPVDRHIFVKRLRVWLSADGFVSPLNRESLVSFLPGPPARWQFIASAGDGRSVEIHLSADMLPGRNTAVFRFIRPNQPPAFGKQLPANRPVQLIVRADLVDRNFHWETHRNEGAEHHFTTHSHTSNDKSGFDFVPAPDRRLQVWVDAGKYHPSAEWSTGIFHPVEASRGQEAHEDAFSPGWFEIPMLPEGSATLTLDAEPGGVVPSQIEAFEDERATSLQRACERAHVRDDDAFGRQLVAAIQAFVVRRGPGKTVIAGYPWFLDWGRDSLICARGMLAAGLSDEVRELLMTFGRFEENGTLPNQILGENTSNRNTSDAPLWYGVVCEELAALNPGRAAEFYQTPVKSDGRTIADVLLSIAEHYASGTANGIKMDPASALVWSPAHFTWMDTNFPACTAREGYPVEIQVLWVRLLRQLDKLGITSSKVSWRALADQAVDSIESLFWMEDRGYLADVLLGGHATPALTSVRDTALRSNFLWAISMGIIEAEPARRGVAAASNYLVVPGALRTLAPLPVEPSMPLYGSNEQLLNNPQIPYFGRYEGDEDTRRKPAYHNGTAWTWTFPTFCEALAAAWEFQPAARWAAKAYLGSADSLMVEGCVGHLPEILDGDTPHQQRGCDAQAWAATETFRVWKLLQG